MNADQLLGAALVALDGNKLGKIKDILFDDREWRIRYLVVDTGSWLIDRKVLVLPDQLEVTQEALEEGKLSCRLTKELIESCPPLDHNAPVSRRYEKAYAEHYKAAPYWMGSTVWGIGQASVLVPPTPEEQAAHEKELEDIERCHVRSFIELEGYEVVASNDTKLGQVEGVEIAWETLEIVRIVAKEGGLLRSKEERDIVPAAVRRIDWHAKRVLLAFAYHTEEESRSTQSSPAGTQAALS